eukprot:5845109-Amphidinium_carterae.1
MGWQLKRSRVFELSLVSYSNQLLSGLHGNKFELTKQGLRNKRDSWTCSDVHLKVVALAKQENVEPKCCTMLTSGAKVALKCKGQLGMHICQGTRVLHLPWGIDLALEGRLTRPNR